MNKHRINSYTSRAGLKIYYLEYLHDNQTWYAFGDCSESKEYLQSLIELERLRKTAANLAAQQSSI